jgi:hypothetical protein
MKKLLTIIALLIIGISQAQEVIENEKRRANELGFEFLGLVDGQLLLTYERSFGKHWSALIGGGPKSKEGLVNLSGIDGPSIKTGGLDYSGYKLLLEGRYYLNEFSNGRATGFYLGLYLKYSNFNSDLTGVYINSEDEEFNFLFDAGIGVRSLGLMVGYKLPLSKRFAIDFLIAGPGTGNYKFDIQNKSDDLPDEFFEDLNNALESVGLLDIIDADFEFNRNKRTSVFNTVSFRYAISLKYSF